MDKELVFIFIGTDKHHVDGICPKVGQMLSKKYNLRMMFCDGKSIESTKETIDELKEDKGHEYHFVAIDVGFCNSDSFMLRMEEGLRPSSALKEQNIRIGDIGYVVNIDNIYPPVEGKTNIELFLDNYYSRRVRRRVNQVQSELYRKLDDLIRGLQAIGEDCNA